MKPSIPLYPLRFEPILQPKVWGGKKLHELFGKKASEKIGESWELSGVDGAVSQVNTGPLTGKLLTDLISEYKEALVGKKVYEQYREAFPLLFKFIDAQQDLSIQVHPDDTIAQKRHNSFGKTEMWYVLSAEEEARLVLGFKDRFTQEDYLKALDKGTVAEIMREVPVKKGDTFYLSPGTVHAIGGGIVLAEIQQTSDITYRIYDWNRPDIDGNLRELHTAEALDVMSFTTSKEAELAVNPEWNKPTLLCESPFFHTSLLKLSQSMERDYRSIDSFIVYMCTEGNARLFTELGALEIKIGDTVLLPACIESVNIDTKGATILEVYVPST